MTEHITQEPTTSPIGYRIGWHPIGVVALAAAVCATLTWAVAGPLADGPPQVHQGDDVREIGVVSVIVSSLLVAGAAGALLRWWQARSERATRHWTVLALVIAVLSLITPTSAVSLSDGMALVSLHALVAAVVIVGLRRASAVARTFSGAH